MARQAQRPVEGLAHYVGVPNGYVHLSAGQLAASDVQPADADEHAKFSRDMRIYHDDWREQANIMADKLRELGYDVSAYTRQWR